eukprot:TRINITY_DN9548_c0_g1_i1.p1 TRINITY_DN9548_c0_g1~~TRINITY_DN9548_c0_g1_i1.p1  ORF type:complete len:1246 (-),score=397.08 TRINITY_DN9548_c0_g1_i1:21-3758(-)
MVALEESADPPRVIRPWDEDREELDGWGPAVPADLEKKQKTVDEVILEPFAFDSDHVPSLPEWKAHLMKRLEFDQDIKGSLKTAKGELLDILQDCLNRINEQLEKGEECARAAYFPLVNTFDFGDFEAIAKHDFTIDLHSDVVDEVLKKLKGSLLASIWRCAPPENPRQAKMLVHYNQALQERMQLMEKHLQDRARALTSLRCSYFLEITHLRNQVYLMRGREATFEPVEAYFFDPCDSLEENLREQLNGKITQSLTVKERQLQKAKQIIEELEDQLASALNRQDLGQCELKEVLQVTCRKHGELKTVETLAEVAPKEAAEWAAAWCKEQGWVPKSSLDALRKQLEDTVAAMQQELDRTREALKKAESELEQERQRLRQLEAELEQSKAATEAASAALAAKKPQQREAKVEPNVKKEEDLVKQLRQAEATIEELRRELRELQRRAEAEAARLAELQAALAKAKAELEAEEARRARLEAETGKAAAPIAEAGVSEADLQALEDYHSAKQAVRPLKSALGISDGLGNLTRDLGAIHAAVLAEREDAAQKAKEAEEAQRRLRELEKQLEEERAKLQEELQTLRQRLSQAEEALSEAVASRRSSVADAPQSPVTEREAPQKREAEGRTGAALTLACQTNITAHSDSGFYLLEVPPTCAEEAVREEVADLQACAQANWAATLEQIRASKLPPEGVGNGFCARGCFIRLFQAAKQRLIRHDELIAMIEALKRAELHQVLQGVHLLMESRQPDLDADLRDLVFGRGFTLQNVVHSRGLEFTELCRRQTKLVTRIVRQLLKSRAHIELDVHPRRRTYVPGGAAGPRHFGDGLYAGSGLLARQVRDSSPTKEPLWAGLLTEEEIQDMLSMSQEGSKRRPRERAQTSSSSVTDDMKDFGQLHFLALIGKSLFACSYDDDLTYEEFLPENADPASLVTPRRAAEYIVQDDKFLRVSKKISEADRDLGPPSAVRGRGCSPTRSRSPEPPGAPRRMRDNARRAAEGIDRQKKDVWEATTKKQPILRPTSAWPRASAASTSLSHSTVEDEPQAEPAPRPADGQGELEVRARHMPAVLTAVSPGGGEAVATASGVAGAPSKTTRPCTAHGRLSRQVGQAQSLPTAGLGADHISKLGPTKSASAAGIGVQSTPERPLRLQSAARVRHSLGGSPLDVLDASLSGKALGPAASPSAAAARAAARPSTAGSNAKRRALQAMGTGLPPPGELLRGGLGAGPVGGVGRRPSSSSASALPYVTGFGR